MTQAAARPGSWTFASREGEPAWLARRRREAFERFERDGFPQIGRAHV